jgi:hypothetical protein
MAHSRSVFVWLLALLVVRGATSVHAGEFANRFIRFTAPSGWRCDLSGTEWVCQQKDNERSKQAIIVIAAKEQGDSDSLDQYEAHLKQPRTFTMDGRTLTSRVIGVKRRTIGTLTWIDSLHDESEIPGFVTRYLATVQDGVAVLFTYSVRRERQAEYQDGFDQLVNSLKVKNPLKQGHG